jgi:hypothetical protein
MVERGMTTGNLEPLARALCEKELRAIPGFVETDLHKQLDRYWPVIAAEILANLRDEVGALRLHSAAEGLHAWETWLDEHPTTNPRES